jgi:hypothetical protein
VEGSTGRLAVLVPTRGRPGSLARLIKAVRDTAGPRTHVIAGVDPDDPCVNEYLALDCLGPGDQIEIGRMRLNLSQWTNHLWAAHRNDYAFFASLGDDMVPRTMGWDAKLTGAIDGEFGGTGITYPWDGVRDDIPEAFVMSADIPAALGWMMQPSLAHWWVDNVVADLGHGAGCIRQLRGVVIQHLNIALGGGPPDQTAIDAGATMAADKAAYEEWCRNGRSADVDTIKRVRSVSAC